MSRTIPHPQSPSSLAQSRASKWFTFRVTTMVLLDLSLAVGAYILGSRGISTGFNTLDFPGNITMALAFGLGLTTTISIRAQGNRPRPPWSKMRSHTVLAVTLTGIVSALLGISALRGGTAHNMQEAWIFGGLVIAGLILGLVVVYLAPPARRP